MTATPRTQVVSRRLRPRVGTMSGCTASSLECPGSRPWEAALPERVWVLIVEDEFLIQELIKDSLSDEGYGDRFATHASAVRSMARVPCQGTQSLRASSAVPSVQRLRSSGERITGMRSCIPSMSMQASVITKE